jgi:hypothetical protein
MSNTKKNVWKSILAVVVGFVVTGLASALVDFTMNGLGVLNFDDFKNSPTWVIATVVAYRFLFNTIGSYTTARLAPINPMRLVMIGGTMGFVLSIIGAVSMWEKAAPWYNIAIVIIALPSAYIGGRLYVRLTANSANNNSR